MLKSEKQKHFKGSIKKRINKINTKLLTRIIVIFILKLYKYY